MSVKTINALLDRMAATPAGHADQLGLNFLLQICSRLHDLGMSNADLAKRMGTTPAYITRLFGGSANLSTRTMAKLAQAAYGKVQIEFAPQDAAARPART
jgi:transcriptional regulator with XRE-family HTH domain